MPDSPKKKENTCHLCQKGIFSLRNLPKHLLKTHLMSVEVYRQMFSISEEALPSEPIEPKKKTNKELPPASATALETNIDIKKYCKEMKEQLMETYDYPDSPVLDEAVYLMGINVRLRESNEKAFRLYGKQNPELLKSMRDNSKHIAANLAELDRQLAAARDPESGDSIASLHRQTLDDAEAFIKANIGEFSFQCGNCSSIVTTGGLPHWALLKDPEGNWVAWSRELADLVVAGTIRMHHMAYALRTSIEALVICAKARGFTFPIFHKQLEEEKLKELMLQKIV